MRPLAAFSDWKLVSFTWCPEEARHTRDSPRDSRGLAFGKEGMCGLKSPLTAVPELQGVCVGRGEHMSISVLFRHARHRGQVVAGDGNVYKNLIEFRPKKGGSAYYSLCTLGACQGSNMRAPERTTGIKSQGQRRQEKGRNARGLPCTCNALGCDSQRSRTANGPNVAGPEAACKPDSRETLAPQLP